MTPVGVFFICQNEDKCHFVNSTNLSQSNQNKMRLYNTKAHRRKKLHIHLKADNIRYCYCKIRFFHLMSIQTKN